MSPRYSIIPGAFCDDERARLMHYKVMTRIGRHIAALGLVRDQPIEAGHCT